MEDCSSVPFFEPDEHERKDVITRKRNTELNERSCFINYKLIICKRLSKRNKKKMTNGMNMHRYTMQQTILTVSTKDDYPFMVLQLFPRKLKT